MQPPSGGHADAADTGVEALHLVLFRLLQVAEGVELHELCAAGPPFHVQDRGFDIIGTVVDSVVVKKGIQRVLAIYEAREKL